jgi:hypothetical protein
MSLLNIIDKHISIFATCGCKIQMCNQISKKL